MVVGHPARNALTSSSLARVDRRRAALELARSAPRSARASACQSSTAARTSSSTRSMSLAERRAAARGRARARPRRAGSTRRSRPSRAAPGSSTSIRCPSSSRRTRITGWITRSIPYPWRAELHRHRVDDERHVVGDDLDHRVRRLPAVLLELGVVDVHLDLAGRAHPGPVPVRDRGAVQVERAAVRPDPRPAPSGSTGARTPRTARPARRAAARARARRRRRSAPSRGPPPLPPFLLLLGAYLVPLASNKRRDGALKCGDSHTACRRSVYAA